MKPQILTNKIFCTLLCCFLFSSLLSQPSFNSSIRALHVIDSNSAVFAGSGGLVGYTKDGGLTWDTTRWGSISYRACSVVNDHLLAASIESPGMVIKAPLTSLSSTTTTLEDTNEGAFFDSMKFLNSTDGILMGDATPDTKGDICLSVYLTFDSGDHWERIPCVNLPEHIEGEAAFAASNGNISCFNNSAWIATGGKVSRVFYSSDRGATWIAHSTPLIQGGTMTGAFCADFKNDNEGLLIGGDWEEKQLNTGNLAYTSDGGKTWELRSEGVGPGYRSCVVWHPLNSQECLAIGSEGIDYSTDSAINWRHISDDSFYTGRFSPNGKFLWLAGHNSVIRIDFAEFIFSTIND